MEDKLKRGFLFFAAALFAVPTYLLWRNALVEGWPQDLNGWMGLILSPTMSIVALIYAIFYRRAKQVDDELQQDMDDNTRRGKRIYVIGVSIVAIIIGANFVEDHAVKHNPVQEWEYYAYGLIAVIWIAVIVWGCTSLGDKMSVWLHTFLTKKGWYTIDRMIFNDEDDTDE